MIRSQRVVHRLVWLLFVPILCIVIWAGIEHREVNISIEVAPHVTGESTIP